ncbi:hypothetical protein HPB47_014315 [Ixodes persulcatus]|uniref:Uncharacterized protein n=1 Tax=Ixodes persulcatus TaxID=34615 RepID=A0AC60QWC1_IXOPE|nr:hypothetical protein HPB47_014315 [Ixodes persulcatus]
MRELLRLLPLQTSTDNRVLLLTPMLQLLVTLRFYGAEILQVVTGDLVNVSQPTVCHAVGVVTQLITRHLFRELVHFHSATKFGTVMCDFYALVHSPSLSGRIDCNHVQIKSPGDDDTKVFRNRKGVFPINVQAVASPQLQFHDVVASWPGSVHDSQIFYNSRARVLYKEHRVPGTLLGTWLRLLPFPHDTPGRSQFSQHTTRQTRTHTAGRVPLSRLGLLVPPKFSLCLQCSR